VVEYTVFQVRPLPDTWIWYAFAYDVDSQFSSTRLTTWTEPRSTRSHCGSVRALDHAVVIEPSTAFDASRPVV
jgi:hypothetical protein